MREIYDASIKLSLYQKAAPKLQRQQSEDFTYQATDFMELTAEDDLRNQVLSECIPDYMPVLDSFNQSNILPPLGFLMLQLHLPPLLKMREWTLVFSIDRDGCSMHTFYAEVEQYFENNSLAEETIMLVQDQRDSIFGCLSMEKWRNSSKFYGSGENFIFKFRDSRQGEPRLSTRNLFLKEAKDNFLDDDPSTQKPMEFDDLFD